MLLVLEDMHFADPATRGLIEALLGVGRACRSASSSPTSPMSSIDGIRCAALAEVLADDPEVVRIELGPALGELN